MRPVIDLNGLSVDELYSSLWDAYQRFYSLGNITKRLWRFKREYVKYFPRDLAIEELFFSLHIRNSVRHKEHPFTLGLHENR